jgi:hypothetical protein
MHSMWEPTAGPIVLLLKNTALTRLVWCAVAVCQVVQCSMQHITREQLTAQLLPLLQSCRQCCTPDERFAQLKCAPATLAALLP